MHKIAFMRHEAHWAPMSFAGTAGQVAHAKRLGVGTCASFLGVYRLCGGEHLTDVFGLGRQHLSIQVQHLFGAGPTKNDMPVALQYVGT